MDHKEITWKCGYCGVTVTSSTLERHNMDRCICKKSALDLELGYYRTLGKIEIIGEKCLTCEKKWVHEEDACVHHKEGCTCCGKPFKNEWEEEQGLCGECL